MAIKQAEIEKLLKEGFPDADIEIHDLAGDGCVRQEDHQQPDGLRHKRHELEGGSDRIGCRICEERHGTAHGGGRRAHRLREALQ